jgi:hypothetical protein
MEGEIGGGPAPERDDRDDGGTEKPPKGRRAAARSIDCTDRGERKSAPVRGRGTREDQRGDVPPGISRRTDRRSPG